MTDLNQRLTEQENDPAMLEMRKNHITKWRYRVYMFIIFVIIILIEPMFTASVDAVRGTGAFSFSLLDPVSMITKRGEGGKMGELDGIIAEIEKTQSEIDTIKAQIEVVKNLEKPEKQATILNCINFNECGKLGEGLLTHLDLLRAFLLIEGLTADKLDFDQKFLLQNINEYATVQLGRGKLVDIKSITFGVPVEVNAEYKLNKIAVNIDIGYLVNTDFLQFIRNLETLVSQDYPVMRRIENFNYDIVNYLESQDIALSLGVYYINTPRKNLLVQTDEEAETLSGSQGTQIVDALIDSGVHATE